MNWKIVTVAAVAIAVAAGVWYVRQPATVEPDTASLPIPVPDSTPVARSEPVASAPQEPEQPVIAAPSAVDGSDAEARAAANDLAPQLAQWLTPDEQLRKWVLLVDQLADGKLPTKSRPLNYPLPAFSVGRNGDTLRVDRANYTRITPLLDILTAIKPVRMAQYYHAWRPLLDKAYLELGGKGGIDKRLRKAIERIAAVAPLDAPPLLVQPAIYYKYADSKLEAASDVDKLLWRMGPDNARRLQAYLRELEQEL